MGRSWWAPTFFRREKVERKWKMGKPGRFERGGHDGGSWHLTGPGEPLFDTRLGLISFNT